MNVLYSCDSNYLWITAVSMESLFSSNTGLGDIQVFVMGEGISDSEFAPLRKIADRYSRTVHLIRTDAFSIPDGLRSDRWPRSAFMRLFAGSLLPQKVKHVLYLDSDTLVLGSLAPLMRLVDSSSQAIHGVTDCVAPSYLRNIGLASTDHYINAGVLLMDLERMRSLDVATRIVDFLNSYEHVLIYADQDVLNGAFHSEIGVIDDPAYNVTTQVVRYKTEDLIRLRRPLNYYLPADLDSARKSPRIVHYTTCLGVVRPWFENSDHPLSSQFDFHLSRTPYHDHERPKVSVQGVRARLLSLLNRAPDPIVTALLGPIHSNVFPYLKSWKARRSR